MYSACPYASFLCLYLRFSVRAFRENPLFSCVSLYVCLYGFPAFAWETLELSLYRQTPLPLLLPPEERVHLRGDLSLHVGHNVAIRVEREAYLTVA